jgi:hypothetical protein
MAMETPIRKSHKVPGGSEAGMIHKSVRYTWIGLRIPQKTICTHIYPTNTPSSGFSWISHLENLEILENHQQTIPFLHLEARREIFPRSINAYLYPSIRGEVATVKIRYSTIVPIRELRHNPGQSQAPKRMTNFC